MKLDAEGKVQWRKARCVVPGNRLIVGADYTEVYAPASKHTTFCALSAIAAARGWVIHQMDVKTAFLNADLEEDFHVTLPPEVHQGRGGKVTYKLQKAPYGLSIIRPHWPCHDWWQQLLMRFVKLKPSIQPDHGLSSSFFSSSVFP